VKPSGVEILDDGQEGLVGRMVNRRQRHASQSTRQTLPWWRSPCLR
jgi:hypothetical protein